MIYLSLANPCMARKREIIIKLEELAAIHTKLQFRFFQNLQRDVEFLEKEKQFIE